MICDQCEAQRKRENRAHFVKFFFLAAAILLEHGVNMLSVGDTNLGLLDVVPVSKRVRGFTHALRRITNLFFAIFFASNAFAPIPGC